MPTMKTAVRVVAAELSTVPSDPDEEAMPRSTVSALDNPVDRGAEAITASHDAPALCNTGSRTRRGSALRCESNTSVDDRERQYLLRPRSARLLNPSPPVGVRPLPGVREAALGAREVHHE